MPTRALRRLSKPGGLLPAPPTGLTDPQHQNGSGADDTDDEFEHFRERDVECRVGRGVDRREDADAECRDGTGEASASTEQLPQ